MENVDKQKPIHLVHCRECQGYHRINIKMTVIGDFPTTESLPDRFYDKLFRGELKCPKTGETFIAAEDDWLHLTQAEFEALSKRK